MRLLIMGDLHFFRTRLTPGEWLSKRMLGQTNLLLNRRHQFNHGLFPAMLERAMAHKPDAAILTGDLTTTALGREFADVQAALAPLAARMPVFAVPGNHDRYTFASARQRLWETVCGESLGAPASFPAMKPLGGRWHVLLLDSACPRIFSSRGRLGRTQLAQTKQLLDGLPAGDGVVVVCHYPLFTPEGTRISWNRDMAGRAALVEMLAASAARVLYLHGHIHQPWHLTVSADGTPFDCINAGAPCQTVDKNGRLWPDGQGFWIVDLPEDVKNMDFMLMHATGMTKF